MFKTANHAFGVLAVLIFITPNCDSVARAVPLAPGDNVFLFGTPAPSGTVLAEASQPLMFNDGILTSRVIRDDITGNLDFLYIISGNVFDVRDARHVSIVGYSDVLTDVDYLTPTGFVHPFTAARSQDGSSVIFDGWGINAQDPSISLLLVKTNAQNFTGSGTLTITLAGEGTPPLPGQEAGQDIVLSFSTYEPLSVPEPGTGLLLLYGAYFLFRSPRGRKRVKRSDPLSFA